MPQKSTAIFIWLCCIGLVTAADKPPVVSPVPAAQHVADEAGQRAAAAATAAIEALGANPSTRQISNIVFRAVRSSPSAVLPIVHAAVLASPQAAAPEIVTAATAAVPDPWKKVTYHRIASSVLKKSSHDGKQVADGKRTADRPDFKGGPGTKSPAVTADPEITLAEAIVRTALDAQPGLALASLQSAADIALTGDPAVLLHAILSPQSVSGVGGAGLSNYANEPLRPAVASTAPVPAPNPPVVSH